MNTIFETIKTLFFILLLIALAAGALIAKEVNAAPDEDKIHVRCTSGNTDIFNKPVDSVHYPSDREIIVYIHKTRYRIRNAACVIKVP